MEKAIKRAIERGWKCPTYFRLAVGNNVACGEYTVPLAVVLFDPLFWQALGKVEGWDKETITFQVEKKTIERLGKSVICPAHSVTRPRWKGKAIPWLVHWHDFIDHVASGKSVDEFFNQLLK